MHYIRFQTTERDEKTTQFSGIFQLAYQLRDSSTIFSHDKDYLKELLIRFDQHLDAPSKFNRKNTPGKASKGISRYKETAYEYISQTRELVRIMQEYSKFTFNLV